MADSPIPGGAQRPPSAHNHPRRNNNNNRKSKSNQLDGAVSDGAAIGPTVSPRTQKAQNKQRQNLAPGTISQQDSMDKGNAHKHRPASVNVAHITGTPAKEQAYAGPTFQSSPAASSLPVPRCFSRSLPNNATHPSLQARLAGEKTPEEPGSSPEPDIVAPALPRESQQSPLDFFFQADRAEKERTRGGTGSLSPVAARRPLPPSTVLRTSYQSPDKGIFLQELDGGMPSPRTVPPSNRPVPHRSTSSPARNESDDDRQAKTQSLKQLLWNHANGISTPPSSHHRNPSGSQTPEEFFGSPSPFNRSPSGPSTPQPSSGPNPNYSLHYGNRNLSPLFKAARSDTPPRPSSLRQEVSNHNSGIDPDTFARSYLQDQIRTSGPARMPQLSFADTSPPLHRGHELLAPVPMSAQSAQSDQGGPPGAGSPHNGVPDVRSMEDNLRRMLKIA